MNQRKILLKIKKILITFAAILILSFLFFPFFWATVSSFMHETELFSRTPKIAFSTLDNYITLFQDSFFINALKNSAILAPLTTLLTLLISTFSSYGLSRMRIPGRGALLLLIVFFQMLPTLAYIVPLFVFFNALKLLGTYYGLIIVFTLLNLPLSVYLLKTYFDSLPYGLEEAALVDGASYLTIITRIILPLSLPGLFTVGIFAFTGAWNELLFALVFSDSTTQTLPVKIVGYGQVSGHTRIALMLTGSVITSIPPVIIALLFSKYLLKGLTSGAFKY